MSPMLSRRLLSPAALTLALVGSVAVSMPAQQAPQVSPNLFAEMRWRNIGPHRAGRTKAAAGVPSQSGGLTGVMNILQGADVRPTTVQLKAIATARTSAAKAAADWAAVKSVDLPALNAKLTAAGLPALTL